jgi:thioredoxin-like negative regulator of GroEL/predicted aspartyl protease
MTINSFRELARQAPFRIRLFLIPVFIIVIICASVASATDIQNPDDDTAGSLTRRASKQIKKGALTDAEKLLKQALDISPKNLNARLTLAYLLVKKRRWAEAYELSLAIAKAEPKNSRAFAVLGMALLNAGRFPEAKTILYNAIGLNKREALAWAGCGLLDFYENRINDSLANLRIAVFQDPTDADFVFTLAQVSARAEQYKEAADAYNLFLSIADKSDTERRERIKGLIDFLRYLGQKESLYVTAGQDSTSVPISIVGNRPIIQLKINDNTRSLRFVLDTGSGISVISNKTAAFLKLKPVAHGGFAKGIGGDGKFEIIYGFLRQVGIGDVKIRNVPVYIREFHNTNEDIDGYIGLSLISKFLTTLDYGKQTFDLRKKDGDAVQANSDTVSLPLRLTSSGFLSGEVQLEGIDSPLNFIVDTGASVSVISDDIAGMDKVSHFVREEKLRVIGSAGVTDDVPTFLLPKVSFGTHTRKSVTAIALDLGLINEASGFEQSGILGGNFLRNYKLTFDFKNSKVTFVPISQER